MLVGVGNLLTSRFLAPTVQAVLFIGAGVLLLGSGIVALRRESVREVGLPLVRSVLPGRAQERKRPKVVIFAGTEGLVMLLRIAQEMPWDVVGIVPPVGGGVSFARLRRELSVSPDQIVFPTLYSVEVVAELGERRAAGRRDRDCDQPVGQPHQDGAAGDAYRAH
ncbi:MAG: hypothetical protein M5R40_23880 [Anaerolineae bacterium]|nr:hypothetical protein [Anaerolineae bacterium]